MSSWSKKKGTATRLEACLEGLVTEPRVSVPAFILLADWLADGKLMVQNISGTGAFRSLILDVPQECTLLWLLLLVFLPHWNNRSL